MRGMRYLLILLVTACASPAQYESNWQQALSARESCYQAYASAVSGQTCAEPKMRSLMKGYPYMDLVEAFIAYDRALASKVDSEEISRTEASANIQLLHTQLYSEAVRRSRSSTSASWAQILAGAALIGSQPRTGFVTCQSVGPLVQCY